MERGRSVLESIRSVLKKQDKCVRNGETGIRKREKLDKKGKIE